MTLKFYKFTTILFLIIFASITILFLSYNKEITNIYNLYQMQKTGDLYKRYPYDEVSKWCNKYSPEGDYRCTLYSGYPQFAN